MKYLYLLLLSLLHAPIFAQIVFKNYDIDPGADSSSPWHFTNYNGNMYFCAFTKAYGAELWMIDKNGSTQMLTNINNGNNSGAPEILGEINGKLILAATDSAHGIELWITDGSAAGTKLLKDIYPGNQSSLVYGIPGCVYNGRLYFSAATAASGLELWSTDGTDTGTHLVADINPGASASSPAYFNVINGKLVFWADDGTHDYEPWITDGTQAGTTMLKDINPSAGSQYHNSTLISNGLLYFWAVTSGSFGGIKVWVTDGTPSGTIPLKAPTSPSGAFISKFVAYKGKVYYWNSQDTGIAAQLWVTDGTYAGTHVFSNAAPNTYFHCGRDFLVFKDKLYFTGGLYRQDTISGCELWVTDGTDAGTKLVVDLGGKYNSNPYYLASLGDYIYFLAQDSDVINMYRTDGTTAGTQLLAPNNATNKKAFNWGYEHTLHLYNNKLWTLASFTNTGMELWSVEDMFPQSINISSSKNTFITLYPNPAHHNFTIKTTTAFKAGSITLTDVTSRVVKTEKLYNNQQTIPLQGIAPGMYIADVWLDDKRSTQKLVVE